MSQENQQYDLKLTMNDINTIVGALIEAPFKVASPVINTIDQQIKSQIEAKPAEEDKEPKK